MHPNRRFEISEDIFAARLAHGPLTRQEARYRAFLSCEFWELLDVDPWLATARPTAQGRRILVPLIRQVLGHSGELPASTVDWVRLYRRLVQRLLEYFDVWRRPARIHRKQTLMQRALGSRSRVGPNIGRLADVVPIHAMRSPCGVTSP